MSPTDCTDGEASTLMTDNDKPVIDDTDCNGHNVNVIASKKKEYDTSHPHMKFKIFKQGCLIAIFVTIGLHYGIIGATLPDLRDRLGVLQEEISIMLMGKSVGFILGAIMGGLLFRIFYRKGDLMMLVALVVYGVAIGSIPFARSLELTVALYTVVGIAEGVKNAGGTSMVLHLWEEKAAIPMNIMLCGVGLGSFISPQIVNAFLGDHVSSLEYDANRTYHTTRDPDTEIVSVSTVEYTGNEESWTFKQPILLNQTTLLNLSSSHIMASSLDTTTLAEELQLQLAYLVVSGIILLTSVAQLILVLCGPPKDFPEWVPGPKGNSLKHMASPGSCANGASCYSLQLLSLLFVFNFFTGGSIKSFCNFLFSFATEGSLKMHRSEATSLQSSFWIFYMCGRGLAAPITIIAPLSALLISACFTNVMVGVVLSFFSNDSSITLWVCTCIFGLSCALLQPNSMAWSNLYLKMNSMATMVLLCGLSLGDFTFMAIAGVCYDGFGPDSVKYVSAASSVCLFLVFIIMQTVGHLNRGVVKEARTTVVNVEDGLLQSEKQELEKVKS